VLALEVAVMGPVEVVVAAAAQEVDPVEVVVAAAQEVDPVEVVVAAAQEVAVVEALQVVVVLLLMEYKVLIQLIQRNRKI
jgi:hypothetical protein